MAEFSDERSGAYCMCTRDSCSDECKTYRRFHPKPKTNADRIRSMTDEELADWFSIYCCRNKTYDAHCETFVNCKACWLDWLLEEVADG